MNYITRRDYNNIIIHFLLVLASSAVQIPPSSVTDDDFVARCGKRRRKSRQKNDMYVVLASWGVLLWGSTSLSREMCCEARHSTPA